MTGPVIQAQQLEKRFGKELVLKSLDLSIEPGQVVGLVGMNASGKSTLIRCLLGILRATEGSCRLFGEDSWDLSAASKARLGYVSQDFNILPWMAVKSVCDYTGAFYERWDDTLVEHLLQEWTLPRDKRVSTLSIGQRQKLAVILALGHRPELLILDEPVASLDPVARRQFLQSLIQFTEDARNTILFSTHITSDLERVASHVAMLKDGKLGFFGELDELKDGCKRLRIQAEESLPRNLGLPGTLRSEVRGSTALITLSQLDARLLSEISTRYKARVQVEDLNLEEIFLELSGVSSSDSTGTGDVI